MRASWPIAAFAALTAARGGAADIPGASVVLEVALPLRAGQVAEAVPPRFVLMADGTVFVGGSSSVETTRLDRDHQRSLTDEIEALRKPPRKNVRLPWLGGPTTWSFGAGEQKASLWLAPNDKEKRPALKLEATGDPAKAPPALKRLADVVSHLAAFHHPSLSPYRPAFYRLRATEGGLLGGCRPVGSLRGHFDAAVAEPVDVPADVAVGWPVGATAAHVCHNGKKYVVTLRPLLPGEKR
jgi:hypothetical protein